MEGLAALAGGSDAAAIGGSFHCQHKVHRLLRELKRQEVDVFSCVASIMHDAAFVSELRWGAAAAANAAAA